MTSMGMDAVVASSGLPGVVLAANVPKACGANLGQFIGVASKRIPSGFSAWNKPELRKERQGMKSSSWQSRVSRGSKSSLIEKFAILRFVCSYEDEARHRDKKPPFRQCLQDSRQALFLGCSTLAIGLALSACKPVLARSVIASPTTSTKDVARNETSTQDKEKASAAKEEKRDQASGQADGTTAAGKAEESDPDFEPPFGEGSDLTTDATEIMFRSFLERHPNDVKALQALLFFRMKKGEVSAAIGLLDKLVELEPKNIEWKYMRAQTLDFAGELDHSQKGFKEILKLEPFSARAYQGLAVVLQKQGEASLVLEMLEGVISKAVDLNRLEEARNLRMLLGQMHTIQGNLKEALQQYNIILKDDPNDFRPYLCKGLIYSILGMSKEADQFFRRYRKLCPKDFPNRGYLDELMLQAKTESRKLKERKEKESEDKAKDKKPMKPLKQPVAVGGDRLSRRGHADVLDDKNPGEDFNLEAKD